jgi:L-ribulose-5-phosphate 3-epimerase
MIFPQSVTVISDEVSQDLPDVIRFVREFGFPGIELRSMFGRAFKDLTAADVKMIAQAARDEGWRIFGCASPVFKCELDDAAAHRVHLDHFRRSLDVAQQLGCDLVRVFTFLRRAPAANQAAIPRVAAHLADLSALAAGTGIRLGVENEHSCIVATADEAAALLALTPSPALGIVWDPCNVLYVPEAPLPATRGYAAIAARVFHVHIKDAQRRAKAAGVLAAEATPVGAGDVGWRGHLAEIAASGYRGMLSLETHWRVQQLDEAALHLPAGYEFSRGGEAASRVCLERLRGLV